MSEMIIKSPVGAVGEYWDIDPLTIFDVRPSGTSTAQINFEGTDAGMDGNSAYEYKHSVQANVRAPLVEGSFGIDEYVIMYDNIVEIVGTDSNPFLTLNGTYQPDVWVDAEGAFIRMLDQLSTPGHEHVYSCDVHLAQDDGAGNPMTGTIITKPCKFIATRQDPRGFDSFAGTNGDNVHGRSPDVEDFLSSPTWDVLNGAMEIQSNAAIMDTGVSSDPALAVIETQDPDTAWGAYMHPASTDDFAIVGRVNDLDNYWQLKVENAETADPVLLLNEVIAGTETLRESVVMTGQGPLNTTFYQMLRLTFNGDDILGVALLKEESFWFNPKDTIKDDVTWFVRHTSASYNTETRFGFQLPQANASCTLIVGTFFDAQNLAHIDP